MTLADLAKEVASGKFKTPESFISFLTENQIDVTVAGAPMETGEDTAEKEEEKMDKEDEPSTPDGSLMSFRDKAAKKAFESIGS